MKTQSPDTHPDVEKILIEAYRRMTPAEKIASMSRINAEAKRLASEAVRMRYPNADAYEVRLRVAALYLPADLMQKAFGWTAHGQDADLDYQAFGRKEEATERARILSEGFFV